MNTESVYYCVFLLWSTSTCYGLLLLVMVYYYLLWSTTTCYVQLLLVMVYYYLLWSTTTCYGLLLLVMVYYYLLWSTTTCYGLLLLVMVYYYLLTLLLGNRMFFYTAESEAAFPLANYSPCHIEVSYLPTKC